MIRPIVAALSCVLAVAGPALALDGGTRRVNPRNGWLGFEVITTGDDPAGDGFTWAMPGTFDGIGARVVGGSTLRLQVNHETSDATISEVDLDLAALGTAIGNTITGGTTGGVSFVDAARQAYDRWTANGGGTWTATASNANTAFARFCSGQSYAPNTFGAGRGFADPIYITGEEVSGGRLFAIDLDNRDFFQLSGVAGGDGRGLAGVPFDAWENAALLDTGETQHVALLLSPDGGTQDMKLYVGQKGKDAGGNASTDFLARNGLAYGSYYYLNDSLPASGTSTNGSFDTTASGALGSSKLEDVDTSPAHPDRAVLGDQNSGLFTFDFNLVVGGSGLDTGTSAFSIAKIQNHANDTDGAFGDADNVDWTDTTILNGAAHPDGLIFVNEDTGTGNGEIWMMQPDGSALVQIGDTDGQAGAFETSGILDISTLVGYWPGSVLVTNNQGSNASMTVLINPDATVRVLGDTDGDGDVDNADLGKAAGSFTGAGGSTSMRFTDGDMDGDGDVDNADLGAIAGAFTGAASAGAAPLASVGAIPEPASLAPLVLGGIALLRRR